MTPNAASAAPLDDEDLRLIEHEHARLELILRHLLDTCSELADARSCEGCEREKRAACQGRLPSFLHDLMDFVAEHFEHEETIMREKLGHASDDDLRRHRAAHAALLRDMSDMVAACTAQNNQGNTVQALRDLHDWVRTRFAEHARHYDARLIPGHADDHHLKTHRGRTT